MPKQALDSRNQYSTNPTHRQAVDVYISTHGRAARAERAKQRQIAEAMEICVLFCPGEPHGYHEHDANELWAALQRPTGVILSCGVTYARILRDKREIEKYQEKQSREWNEMVLDEMSYDSVFDYPALCMSDESDLMHECYVCDRPLADTTRTICEECRTHS